MAREASNFVKGDFGGDAGADPVGETRARAPLMKL